jgi:hypothetical protein
LRVTKEQVTAALHLMGLTFSDEQIVMMLPGVDRALGNYEALRRVEVPLDTEPAFAFHPGLPGRQPSKGPARFLPTVRRAASRPVNLDDLAFRTVAELAPMVRSRVISSTELTRLYLDRLKKYSPRLTCVITLTEDLALEQAAAADKEIRQGKYRGRLHGIPWGTKDLLATKGIRTTWGAEPYRGHRSRAAAQRGRGACREALDGRAGAGRPVVQRHDENPVECRAELEWIVGRVRLGDRRRTCRILDRHGDPGLNRLAEHSMRHSRSAAHLWPCQPLRRDGPELDHG